MSTSKSNDRLSYGITLLIFGVLYLLDKVGILAKIPYAANLVSVGVFLLVAAAVFLITQPKKILGWIFLVVGIILNADFFFGWMSNYSNLIVPVALIIAGITLVLTSKKKS